MADARGLPSGIVAFAALDDPGVETLLASHAEHAGVRGIRHIVNWHPDPARSYAAADATTSDAWAQGFARLRKYGLSFDLQAYAGQFAHLAELGRAGSRESVCQSVYVSVAAGSFKKKRYRSDTHTTKKQH